MDAAIVVLPETLKFEGVHMATDLENCAPLRLDVGKADAGSSMHRCCCGSRGPPLEVLHMRRNLLQNSEVVSRCARSAQIKNAVSNSFNSFVSDALGKCMRDLRLVDAST